MTLTFDSKQPIEVKLPAGGESKSVKVQFPTDEQRAERQRRGKITVKARNPSHSNDLPRP